MERGDVPVNTAVSLLCWCVREGGYTSYTPIRPARMIWHGRVKNKTQVGKLHLYYNSFSPASFFNSINYCMFTCLCMCISHGSVDRWFNKLKANFSTKYVFLVTISDIMHYRRLCSYRVPRQLPSVKSRSTRKKLLTECQHSEKINTR